MDQKALTIKKQHATLINQSVKSLKMSAIASDMGQMDNQYKILV